MTCFVVGVVVVLPLGVMSWVNERMGWWGRVCLSWMGNNVTGIVWVKDGELPPSTSWPRVVVEVEFSAKDSSQLLIVPCFSGLSVLGIGVSGARVSEMLGQLLLCLLRASPD